MKPFSGVFTPIITPFRGDGTIDEAGMRSNVARWMTMPLTGLVVLGSNGEAPQLEDAEADWVIEIVRGEVPVDRPLIAGTGRESTKATIAATQRAAAAGVDAVLVRTPSFFKSQMTTEVFVRHYSEVADASPVPVLLYNVVNSGGRCNMSDRWRSHDAQAWPAIDAGPKDGSVAPLAPGGITECDWPRTGPDSQAGALHRGGGWGRGPVAAAAVALGADPGGA